ncbi:MAG TPA: RidA family protein [Stellaceae bacterium]|nr:RidA family protein [Stellaceae bacterium]
MPFICATPPAERATRASDIVLVGGWGFISGLGPIDLADDRVPLPEGIERQTKKVFGNLETLLRAAGLGKENVVSVRVSLVEFPRLYERMNLAYGGFFAADRLPARSVVGVSHLTRGAQVEMDFVVCVTPP